MQALTSGDSNAVHGAMRVLTEFCREVTDTQMPQVAPVILPEMYKIFTQDQVYGIRTRGRAVDIFNTCAGMIATMADLQKGIAKQLIFPVLPQFTEAFVQAMQVPDGPTSDSGLKMEIMKALTTLVRNFPSPMAQWMSQILPPVWTTLTQSVSVYVGTVVNGTEDADDPADSDGEVLGFENLVFGVFDFIHGLIETSKFRSTVKKSIGDLLYYVLLYMQMTEDQIKTWTANPDQFVEDEDDDTFSYSVRISSQDLLLSLASEFPKDAAPAICNSVTRHLQEAQVARSAGNVHWWKVHESALLSMGCIRSLIIDSVTQNKVQFDLQGFLQNVVLADLNESVSPYLLGRCLWAASRYTRAMSPELVQRFLQATVSGLHPSQPPSVRISAVRAVFGFCEHLKSSDSTQILVPHLPNIMEGLVTIATQFSSEVLALCMETLGVVIGVDSSFTTSCESKIIPLTIAIFLKYSGDPLIVELAGEIFQELSKIDACRGPLQEKLLPTLISILQAPLDKIPVGLQSICLDFLITLIRSYPANLPETMVQQAFPAIIQCVLKSDDSSTMQSGGECLRAYVSKALAQVCEWRDENGNTGLYYIVQVLSKLLDPKTSESNATFAGRLVSVLISKMGSNLGENLDLILRAVLSKLQQAETLTVIQNLVLVFAHLMHTQMEAVLDFLSSVPDPMGKPALEFVLSEWCSRQHLFYGNYEAKVSTVALTKLLQYAIESNDTRLQDIQVKGDQIVNPSEGIRTRSKAALAPDQWTMIPVLVKIYKLLINELVNQLERNMSTQASADDDDDEEEGWEEDTNDDGGDEEICAEGQTLSSLLGQFANASDYQGFDFEADGEDDEDYADPDALQDPVYQIDLQAHLTQFIQSLSQMPCYSVFNAHHNDNERQVLRSIGISV